MEGYAKVAHLMATYGEFAILRRFKQLNYQNLLYLQAEIVCLEERLQKLVQENACGPDGKRYARDWWFLAHGDEGEATEQWDTVIELRQKLNEYSETLYCCPATC